LNTPLKNPKATWQSSPRFFNPATQLPKELMNVSITDQVNWLFMNVLGKPELINKSIWKRMCKDLMYRSTMSSTIQGYYFNEYSHPDMEKRFEEFTIEKAFQMCLNMRNLTNEWENVRAQRVNK
jgi:hypothetical protein